MTCPRCKCPECAKDGLSAVLSKHVSRETVGRRFAEPREPGKPPVDPDAEQLKAAFDLMPKYRLGDCRAKPGNGPAGELREAS